MQPMPLPRLSRLLAAAFYVTILMWTPVAHARTEVVAADPVIEAGHSGACSVLHVATVCTTGGAVETPTETPSSDLPSLPTSHDRGGDALLLSLTERFGPNRDTGPPAPLV